MTIQNTILLHIIKNLDIVYYFFVITFTGDYALKMEEQHEKMKERISPALSLVADKFCDDMILELTVS